MVRIVVAFICFCDLLLIWILITGSMSQAVQDLTDGGGCVTRTSLGVTMEVHCSMKVFSILLVAVYVIGLVYLFYRGTKNVFCPKPGLLDKCWHLVAKFFQIYGSVQGIFMVLFLLRGADGAEDTIVGVLLGLTTSCLGGSLIVSKPQRHHGLVGPVGPTGAIYKLCIKRQSGNSEVRLRLLWLFSRLLVVATVFPRVERVSEQCPKNISHKKY